MIPLGLFGLSITMSFVVVVVVVVVSIVFLSFDVSMLLLYNE